MTPRANRRSVVIPDETWEAILQAALQQAAKERRPISVSEWIREAIDQRLEREEGR